MSQWSTTRPTRPHGRWSTVRPSFAPPVKGWRVGISTRIRAELQAVQASLAGEVSQTGTLAAQLSRVLFSGAGTHSQAGDLAALLQPASFSGSNINLGELAAGLQPATAALIGSQEVAGTMGVTLAPLTLAASGGQRVDGALAAVLQAAVADLVGTQGIPGTIEAELHAALASAAGSQTQTGAIAAVLRSALFGGSGTHGQTGTLAAQLRQAIFEGAGTKASQVTFDAASAGGTGGSSASWSHNANGAVLVPAMTTVIGTPTLSATYGGVAMTQLGSFAFSGTGSVLAIFGLLSPPSGPQTVVVTSTGGFAPSTLGSSVSYKGVGSFGTPVTNSAASSSSLSLTVPSALNRMAAQAFAVGGIGTGALTISAYNRTQRANPTLSNLALLQGDASGAASIPFTANTSRSSNWGGIGVDLIPA